MDNTKDAPGFYIGNDLKFNIDISADGFDMDDDNYEILLRCGSKKVVVSKEDIVEDDNNHYLLVDTSTFPSGLLQMIVTAFVPDSDFDSGTRREVGKIDLCYIHHT